MKKILLKLSEENYRTLKWIAGKLDINISECLRSLIPNIQPPEPNIIKEQDILFAKYDDLVPVKKLTNKDKEVLKEYIVTLTENKCAVTLAKEIKQHLLDTNGQYLTVNTYKRLGRWVSPYRWTDREKRVKPIAKKISQLLFGHDIQRFD